jgi:hypothetical protein
MIRIYADFNDRTAEGSCWILQHEGADLATKVAALGVSCGDRVLLYQDEDDFEVEATLEFRFVDAVGEKKWLAFPHWDTIIRKSSL